VAGSLIVDLDEAVTLIGGGPIVAELLTLARTVAPRIVAADGGAGVVLATGAVPEAIIGDMDSLDPKARAAFADRLYHIAEQETTDFEKCLARIAAPLVIGVGFLGGRMDHSLASLNVLARHRDRAVILLNEADVCCMVPAGGMRLSLPVGARLSLLPLGSARLWTEGLRWNVDGAEMTPDGFISISNESAGKVRIRAEGPMLLAVPLGGFEAVVSSVQDAFRAR
jgi:thiamine pyrophosphokinase